MVVGRGAEVRPLLWRSSQQIFNERACVVLRGDAFFGVVHICQPLRIFEAVVATGVGVVHQFIGDRSQSPRHGGEPDQHLGDWGHAYIPREDKIVARGQVFLGGAPGRQGASLLPGEALKRTDVATWRGEF